MLARVKTPFAEIRRSLLEVDDRQLSVDELKAISKHVPTEEEVWHDVRSYVALIQYTDGSTP